MGEQATFLGTGWSFPPSFSTGGADVATVADEEDIRQSLEILFGTEPGERVNRDTFGGGLRAFAFESVDQTLLTCIRSTVSNAILNDEPRVQLDSVEVSESADTAGLLTIEVRFTVRETNSRYNMVYPYYLAEASQPTP